MNNKLLVVAAAAAASFATVAQAQSSVTLYGTLDAGITYQSKVATSTSSTNSKARWSEGSGIDQSYFGLRGSEDLGGGLRALFTLESGVNLGNGGAANDGHLFNRQAYVGLSSNYGTVTLGRQYDATQDYLAPLTATGSWGGTYFAHPGNLDNLSTNGGYSLNNTIKYSSANISGLQFGGTYSFSNSSQFSNNRAYSVGAAYQFQGLKLGAAFAQSNNPGTTDGGAITADSAFTGAGRSRVYGAGAGYSFGPAEVAFAWTQSRVDNSAFLSAGNVHTNNYEVNGRYSLTPALALGAAYTYTNGRACSQSTHWNQFGLQADYSLSKRTDVYSQAVYQRAQDGGRASIYNGDPSTLPSTTNNQTAATVGLRHRF